MNSRTKLLLMVMLAVGGAVFGDRGYRQLVEEPARKREQEIERLDRQISEAEDEIVKSTRASDQLLAFEQYSLPSDPEFAQARYQDWLLSLVEQIKLQQPSVDSSAGVPVSIKNPLTKKPQEAYRKYSFSVRGRGNLEQITELLYRFYQAGHLHKIRSISLNPAAGGRWLELSVNIEAIGLNRTDREAELSTASSPRLAAEDRSAYHVISRRNFFSQEGDALLGQVYLSAVTTNRKGIAEAWFSPGMGQRPHVLKAGDALSIPAHEIRLVEIQPQSVRLEVDGTLVTVSLGQSLQNSLKFVDDSLPVGPQSAGQ